MPSEWNLRVKMVGAFLSDGVPRAGRGVDGGGGGVEGVNVM